MTEDAAILLVGGHDLFMDAITARLNGNGRRYRVSRVETPGWAAEAAVELEADVVLLDLDGKEAACSCFATAGRIRAMRPDCRILLLGAAIGDWHIERVLELGLAGVLSKHDLHHALGAAVADVLDGGCWLPAAVRERVVVHGRGLRLAPRRTRPRPRTRLMQNQGEMMMLQHPSRPEPARRSASDGRLGVTTRRPRRCGIVRHGRVCSGGPRIGTGASVVRCGTGPSARCLRRWPRR